MHSSRPVSRRSILILVVLAVWLCSAAAIAQAPSAPTFGTAIPATLMLSACDQVGRLGAQNIGDCNLVKPESTESVAYPAWPIHLPDGALITSFTVYYFDNSPAGDPLMDLWGMTPNGQIGILQTLPVPTGFSGGENSFTFDLDEPIQIDNTTTAYSVYGLITRESDFLYSGFHTIQVRYKLQVSPAPAVATFGDVPTGHPFFQFVEALAASGITSGCGGGNYCPDNPVTRGQMAVFLAKALGLQFPNPALTAR